MSHYLICLSWTFIRWKYCVRHANRPKYYVMCYCVTKNIVNITESRLSYSQPLAPFHSFSLFFLARVIQQSRRNSMFASIKLLKYMNYSFNNGYLTSNIFTQAWQMSGRTRKPINISWELITGNIYSLYCDYCQLQIFFEKFNIKITDFYQTEESGQLLWTIVSHVWHKVGMVMCIQSS